MTDPEKQAIVTVALMAAFADGSKHERERAEVRRIAEGLAQSDAVHLPTLVQDVLMKRATLDTTLPALTTPQARQLAYEMAVCVCDADGVHSASEQAFLAELARGLALDGGAAEDFRRQADAMAQAPLALPAPANAGSPQPATATPSAPVGPRPDEKALDAAILDAAIVNGALELLPESLSTMAIIPLQMRLVYRMGQAYGYELDSGHAKDFIATVGVGLTSQYLEQAGRKLLGGLLRGLGGPLLGGVLGGVGKQAVSSGMSFIATYALGQVARRYYAGGRVLTTEMLKDTYAQMADQARGLYGQHRPAIEAKARSLDAGQVAAMVRGR